MLQKIQSFNRLIVGLLAVTALTLSTGCDSESPSGMGTLEVRLHDAPAGYEAVNVFIERVEINRQEDSAGWITINEPKESFNLLELANGAYEVLGEAELEAGTYQQLRLILSRDGHSIVVDGQEYPMSVPSGTQTGIKINIDAEVEEDITYVLLLDFDAARSVVQTGQTNNYLLKPVIKAENKATSGNIEGTILPAEAQSIVYAIADSDTLTSTYTDTTDGYFKLVGLEEGAYTVSIDPGNAGYQSKDTTGVEVTAGETSSLGELVLSEN